MVTVKISCLGMEAEYMLSTGVVYCKPLITNATGKMKVLVRTFGFNMFVKLFYVSVTFKCIHFAPTALRLSPNAPTLCLLQVPADHTMHLPRSYRFQYDAAMHTTFNATPSAGCHHVSTTF